MVIRFSGYGLSGKVGLSAAFEFTPWHEMCWFGFGGLRAAGTRKNSQAGPAGANFLNRVKKNVIAIFGCASVVRFVSLERPKTEEVGRTMTVACGDGMPLAESHYSPSMCVLVL